MRLDAISHAIERGENEDATKSETLSVFAGWVQGTYGSGSDTDMFTICPRSTDGTVMLGGNYTRVLDFFAKLGESRGVLAFEATLEYTRKGVPINLEAFTPPWVAIQPLGNRAVYVFDKDTMYKQQSTLKNIYDPRGRRVCAVSTTNESAVLPRDAFTSRPPNDTLFNPRFRVSKIVLLCMQLSSFMPAIRATATEGSSLKVSQSSCHPGGPCSLVVLVYILRAVVLIPKDRIRRALHFERERTNTISSLKRVESPALGGPEWELPIYLRSFPIEADCLHLLEILDISVTRRKFKVWEEVMEILCRFKSINEIGTSRISAAIKVFSFKKVQPL
jgi:hypothetical protein